MTADGRRLVKRAVAAIDRFEETLAQHARSRGFDGMVRGHIHHARMRVIGGILYLNDGDWVESCTALVKHPDERLDLVDWAERERPAYRQATQRCRPEPGSGHARATDRPGPADGRACLRSPVIFG